MGVPVNQAHGSFPHFLPCLTTHSLCGFLWLFSFLVNVTWHKKPKAPHSWLSMDSDTIVFHLPCVCSSCFHVPARSIDTDQDTLETKAATKPHQSPEPIKSWWQRENRESKQRLMCVAAERQKDRGPRHLCVRNYPNHLYFYCKYTVYRQMQSFNLSPVLCSTKCGLTLTGLKGNQTLFNGPKTYTRDQHY